LAAEYPDDTGALTGLGDGYLRAGTYLRSSEPFTARQDFKSAIVEYNRASALGDAREAVPGRARALIGLGEPAEAARMLQPLASASAFPGPLLEILIAADEAPHDFGAAETAARHLDQLGTPAYPDGVALFPQPRTKGLIRWTMPHSRCLSAPTDWHRCRRLCKSWAAAEAARCRICRSSLITVTIPKLRERIRIARRGLGGVTRYSMVTRPGRWSAGQRSSTAFGPVITSVFSCRQAEGDNRDRGRPEA
jgi:hypothetical protein